MELSIKAYVQGAIAVEETGLEVPYKETSQFQMPQELKNRFYKSAASKLRLKH